MVKNYVYLIGWTELDTWYCGLRCANKVSAEYDLWVFYFTSSTYVRDFRESNGEPDHIQILGEFDTRQEAADFERSYLTQQFANKNERFLNRAIVRSDGLIENGWKKSKSESHRKKIGDALRGRRRPKGIFEKVRKTKIERYQSAAGPRTPEINQKISATMRTKFKDPEFKKKWADAQPTYLHSCPCCGFEAKPNVIGNHKKKCFRENGFSA